MPNSESSQRLQRARAHQLLCGSACVHHTDVQLRFGLEIRILVVEDEKLELITLTIDSCPLASRGKERGRDCSGFG